MDKDSMSDSKEERASLKKIHGRAIAIVFIDIILVDIFLLVPKEKYLQGSEILPCEIATMTFVRRLSSISVYISS